MERLRTLTGASLVLALLVLPTAISAGQDPGGTDPAATDPAGAPPSSDPAPPAPPSDPGDAGQQGGDSGGGAQPGDGGGGQDEGGSQPEGRGSQPTVSTATTEVSATPRQKGIARAAGSVTVSMGDNFYSPSSVSIDVGDTVTWTNGGQAQHSATATDGSFDTGVFGPGGSRSNTFTQAGTFNYFCTVHGNAQSGTVTVASASGGGDGPSEADAVASGGAGGSSTGLPASGSNALPPLVVGLLLLAAGLAIRLRARPGPA